MTVPPNILTTAELAQFDQQWRSVERSLDAVLRVYHQLATDGEASHEVDLICFTAALSELVRREDCAAVLACAVARLAGQEQP